MKSSKKGMGYFGILVKNFILFALVIILFFVFVFATGSLIMTIQEKKNMTEPVGTDINFIEKGKYSDFSVSKNIGKNGMITVFNCNYELIYCSNDKESPDLSYGIIRMMPDEYNEGHISRNVFYKDGKAVYQLALYNNVEKENTVIMSDKNKKLVYSTIPDMKEEFTDAEFAYISGTGIFDKYSISKFKYIGADRTSYTVLFFRNDYDKWFDSKKRDTVLYFCIIIYILMLAISSLFLIITIDRSVKKPLYLLNKAIQSFTDGNRDQPIVYTGGPKEFRQLLDNFNGMARRLNASERERIEAEGEKNKMLSDISHDLKTPITVIQGYAKAVADGVVSPEEQKDYLKTIYQKSKSLAELINTFSEYSKLERPDYKLKKMKTDMCKFVREYLIDKYNELEFMGYNLEADIPERQEIYSMIDVFQIKRVFENFVSNTMKYNGKGTTVYFTVKKVTAGISICIGDNGKGLPETVRRNIFKPFTVGDNSRNTKEGSGLGLAIAKKIVELHGGKLSLKEYSGLSTEFEIILQTV